MFAKKILMAASVGLTLSASAIAQPTANLTVTGKIAPAACSLTLSGGGVLDFGKVSTSPLDSTWLPNKTVNLKVACGADTRFALKTIDNRKASNPIVSINSYGLGNKISYYTLHIEGNQQGDGKPVVQLFSKNNGSSWATATSGTTPFRNDGIAGFARPGGTTAESFQNLALELIVTPRIFPTKNLTDDIFLDGSATIELVYL